VAVVTDAEPRAEVHFIQEWPFGSP